MIDRVWNGASRSLAVVFGGLLALQGSDQLDASKVAYLAVASLATIGAVWVALQSWKDARTVAFRPWFIASAVVAGVLAVSLAVALAHHTSPTAWLRDASAYALVAAAPWLALDLARAVSRQVAVSALLIAGVIAAVSFDLVWSQRRLLVDVQLDRLALPSFSLGAVAYCVALALAIGSSGRQRLAWTALATALIAGFLATGTRTSLVLLAAPAVMAVVALIPRRERREGRAAFPIVAQGVAVVLVIGLSLAGRPPAGPDVAAGPSLTPGSPSVPGDTNQPPSQSAPPLATLVPTVAPKVLGDRFDTISTQDPSLRERWAQTQAAWTAFVGAPLLGVGPGFSFAWESAAGEARVSTWLDSPVIVLAKFGALGLLLAAAIIVAFASTIRMNVRLAGWTWVGQAVLAYAVVLTALLPFGWPLEEKGTGLALILLLGVAVRPGPAQREAMPA